MSDKNFKIIYNYINTKHQQRKRASMQTNMNLVFYSMMVLLSFSLLMQNSFAVEETGNMDLLLKYENGNKASIDSTILKIYKDSEKTPLREIPVQSNPISITGLPLDHKYKIEVYYNDHFQSVDYYDLKKTKNNFEMTVKLPGGIKLEIFYKDGQTPIPKANIFFKTMSGKIVGYDETDFNGDTVRFWLPQTIGNEYYNVDVVIDPALKFTYTPLQIQSSLSKDIKIVTEWPKIIDSAISIQVYKDEKTKVTKSDGNFIVQVNDKKKTKISESLVSYKGDATISNIPVGTYAFYIVSKDDGKVIASKKVTLDGSSYEPIKIFINDPQLNFDALYCNCVAFRFDDIQDHFLSNAQIQMMKVFGEMNAGLTVGVIGGATGKDPKLVETIKEQLQTNPRFEIASHSWNNKVITSISPEEQEKYIKNTDDKIYELFQVKPRVFIPPENIFDNKTITLLKKYDYDHISASVSTEIPPKFVKSDFYHFDTAVSTARLDPVTAYWNQLSKDKITEQVNDSLFDYGYAVVMMHPYEFSNYVDGSYVNEANQTKFTELKSIITDLKSKGYLLTPVGKIDKYDSETFQNSVKNQTSTENIKPNCNCIAFKIDNIQDFWLNDVQNNLINTFSNNKLPVTISILGKFFGTDPKVVDFLKQQVQNEGNQLSVAIRGWEYVDHSLYGMEEQSSSIQQTNKQLSKILGLDSNIFSPPFGKFNNSTLDALKQNNISYISTMTTTDPPNLKSKPIHIPETSYIPNLLDDDPFLKGTIAEKMLAKIQTQQKQYGYALVSMQPSDFAVRDGEFKNQTNEERIKLLEELIDQLKENNIKIVSLSDIPQEVLFEKYPVWIKQIYAWHEQGQITDIELDNAINNLISRMIIITH